MVSVVEVTYTCDVEGCDKTITITPQKESLENFDVMWPPTDWGLAHDRHYCPDHFEERVLGVSVEH